MNNTVTQPANPSAPITRAELTALRCLMADTLRHIRDFFNEFNVPREGADRLMVINEHIYRLENEDLR
ncbi:MAG: hypothetical protein LBV61_07670 [Burkholderiaceae bacterium]|nr:hypothetical protein [Burkholderiaceae bacterium]